MQTAVLLSVLFFFSAAFAAPAEDLKTEDPKAEYLNTEPLETEELQAVEAAPEEELLPLVADSASEDAPEGRFNFCPSGWFFHNARCFLIVNTARSWYQAEEHCSTLGANLASATTPTEYKFMQQMTQTAGQSAVWIGGFYLQGRWMWIDGQGMYYQNWQTQYTATSRSCVYLQSTRGWINTSCGTTLRFICSKNPFSC